MSSRFLKTLLLAAVIVGGIWILVNRDRIRQPSDVVNVLQENLTGWTTHTAQSDPNYAQQWSNGYGGHVNPINQVGTGQSAYQQTSQQRLVSNVIRIGSFKLNASVTEGPINASIDLIADICRRYDAIAFQEISSVDNSWLAQLTDRMNAMGAAGVGFTGQNANAKQTKYSFVSDREHNRGSKVQSAIVYNQATLELDQSQWYTVNDPDNLLSRQPIVAWFRARGPAPDQALTFTLANLRIDPSKSDRELAHLGDLFRAIRNDGRDEDDVLIVGDFNVGDAGLQPVRKMAGLTWVVSNKPTNTKHSSQFDNLVFSETATVEFTGRGGVFDFMRFYNLTLEDALSISEHMPVWAEFSIVEGRAQQMPTVQGTPGRVAGSETDLDAAKPEKKR